MMWGGATKRRHIQRIPLEGEGDKNGGISQRHKRGRTNQIGGVKKQRLWGKECNPRIRRRRKRKAVLKTAGVSEKEKRSGKLLTDGVASNVPEATRQEEIVKEAKKVTILGKFLSEGGYERRRELS